MVDTEYLKDTVMKLYQTGEAAGARVWDHPVVQPAGDGALQAGAGGHLEGEGHGGGEGEHTKGGKGKGDTR